MLKKKKWLNYLYFPLSAKPVHGWGRSAVFKGHSQVRGRSKSDSTCSPDYRTPLGFYFSSGIASESIGAVLKVRGGKLRAGKLRDEMSVDIEVRGMQICALFTYE